jgi:hypothetical protein
MINLSRCLPGWRTSALAGPACQRVVGAAPLNGNASSWDLCVSVCVCVCVSLVHDVLKNHNGQPFLPGVVPVMHEPQDHHNQASLSHKSCTGLSHTSSPGRRPANAHSSASRHMTDRWIDTQDLHNHTHTHTRIPTAWQNNCLSLTHDSSKCYFFCQNDKYLFPE